MNTFPLFLRFLGAFAKLRTSTIFMKFDIWVFLKSLLRKFKFHLNMTRITGTLHEDRYTFLIISRSLPPRMKNVSDESCRENQNTHFVSNKIFFPENRALYGIMWKNVERGRSKMTIWRMCFACWMPKATNTHSKHSNSHCFSTAAMVARMCLDFTSYLQLLSCYICAVQLR